MIGIIRAKHAYLKRYGEAFPEPKKVGAYNLDIDDDATAVVRARLEAAHKAQRADRATFDTARRKTTQFVLAVVALLPLCYCRSRMTKRAERTT